MRPHQADSTTPGTGPAISGRARWRLPHAPRPKYIQLETVTKCNAKCPFCPQNEIVRDPGRMPEITRYIKENDPTAKVEFNTNGELMTEELGRALLEAGVDIMRFSIDGFSPETYEPSRVGISYAKVLERTTAFLDLWDREGYRDKVFTELRMIEVPENRHELETYRSYWEPRCSEVLITQLYQWPWTGQKAEDVVLKPCLKILDEMFFYTDGNATLCCWDVHEKAVVGNVTTQSVGEIWESHAAACLRELLDDGRRDLIHLCSRCNAYEGYDFDRFLVED